MQLITLQGGLGEVISLLGPYIAFIAIAAAIFSYLLAQWFQRKVFPRAEYHRSGPNAETYPCVEVGNRVLFNVGGAFSLFRGTREKQLVTAIIMAWPEVKVFGFRTVRLHHVIEGFNQTVDIRDVIRKNPGLAMGAGSLAVSEGVMATSFDAMAKSVPKTKMDFFMNIIFIMLGFGWGLLLGIIFG